MKITPELAELIGIHFGDGSLYKDAGYNYTIAYCGNSKKDEEYMNRLSNTLNKLFGIRFKKLIDNKKNCITLRTRSKKLFYFYKNFLKIPEGKKIDLRIPNYIKKKKIFLIAFLRGLFDTDGCVTSSKSGKYQYPLIKICTKHNSFAIEILNSLKKLNIHSFLTQKEYMGFKGYDVVVKNKNVKTFLKIIGSNNPRNLLKYKLLTQR